MNTLSLLIPRYAKAHRRSLKWLPSFIVLLLPAFNPTSGIAQVRTGAERMECYVPQLAGRSVGLVVNQTSVVHRSDGTLCPLPDTLLATGVRVACLMAPEHGYRGTADAGKRIGNSIDSITGLPVYSLYGRDKKPRVEWLSGLDIVLFDLQDVGTRFYTYLSTLYYVLQACGEANIPVVVLDRPNPNDTIDGPMRDAAHTSFVSIIPVPLLHGCTLGELAQMMIGESWLNASAPTLNVVPCSGWQHGDRYELPVAPSPNLPNAQAVALYPSLCLFEGTQVSVGRGTDFPFQVYGHPAMRGSFSFTPHTRLGNSVPLQNGQTCHGRDLRHEDAPVGFSLNYLLDAAMQLGRSRWITASNFFDLLAGSETLREQIAAGVSAEEIRASWQEELESYRRMRARYILYPDAADQPK